ncbi:MAG: hypothetical protein J0H34_22485 [Rhizobiales bacterium]|nr:hypothetical protein [Hyphomicrobiales bacterium]
MIVDSLYAALGFKLENEADLRKFEAGLAGAQNKAIAFAGAVTRIGVAVGAAAATGLAALAKSVVSTSAEFEKYEATLTTIEGSSEKARVAMDWIGDFAKKTPFDVAELTRAFVKLRSYGLDPMDGSMTQMGDTAAGMGKSLDQVVEAVADAATFQFERLRELGIVASQAGNKVTFSWTENGKAMTKTINKTSADVTKFLYEVWDKKFSGAMIRQSKTWEGMVSNLGDSWEQFKLKIGRAGFFDAVKARFADLLDYMGKLDDDGTLDRWAKNLSNLFTGVTGSFGRFVWGIQKLGEKVSEALKSLTGGKLDLKPFYVLAGIGAMLTRAFAPWTFWLTVAWLALDEILGYMRGDKTVIGDFIKYIEQLTGASEGLAQAIAAVVGGLGLLFLMKPGLLLGGLGKTLGKLLPFGAAAAEAAPAAAGASANAGWAAAAMAWLGKASPFLAALFTPSSTPKDQNSYLNASPEERQRMRDEARQRTEERNRSTSERAYLANKDSGPGQQSDEPGKVEGGAFVEMLAALERASGKADQPDVETPTIRPDVDAPTVRAKVETPTIRPKVELPDTVNVPPARPSLVPTVKPADVTLAHEKLSGIASGIVTAGETIRSAIEKASAYISESAEAYAAERGAIRDKAAAVNAGGGGFQAMLANMQANIARMSPEMATQAMITDARQDNRDQSQHVTVGDVNVTVQQPTEAPAAVGKLIRDEIKKSIPAYNRSTYADGNAAPIRTPGRMISDSAF